MNKAFFIILLVAMLFGCSTIQSNPKSETDTTAITFRVIKAQEHLGHDTEAGTRIHRFWYDGCKGMLPESKEEVVIWWLNNEIKDTSCRFEDGKTYNIQFKGGFKNGVMGYEGKCLRVTSITGMKQVEN